MTEESSSSLSRRALDATAYASPIMIGLSAFLTSKYGLISKRRNIKTLNSKEKIAAVTAVSLGIVGVVGAVGVISSLSRRKTKKRKTKQTSHDDIILEADEEEEEEKGSSSEITVSPERHVFKSQSAKRQIPQTKAHDPIAHTNSTQLEDSPDRNRSYSMEAHIPEKIESPGQKAKTRKGVSKPHERSKHSNVTKLYDSPDATRSNSLNGHVPENIASPGKAIARLEMTKIRPQDHRSKHSHSSHVEDSPDLTFDGVKNHHPDSIDHHTPSFVGVSPSQKQTRHGPVLHSQKRNVYMERGPDNLTEHHESLDSFDDQSTTSSRMSLPAQRHAKDNYNVVESISEKKNSFVPIEKEEEEEEGGNRSLSPFSESAMSLAEEAWKTFEKKTLSSPSLVKSEMEMLSDDSLGSDDNDGKNTEDSPLKERVLLKRKLEREKEREVLNSKLREVDDAVQAEIRDRCNLIEVDLINQVIRFKKKIKFVKNTVVVKRESHRVLQQAATALKTIRAVIDRIGSEFGVQQLRFECAGHTHAKTPDVAESALHMRVSESRAKAIREFLIDQGVAEMYIVAKGYGGTVPIGKPSQNRRVEIKVLATSPMFMSF